MSNEQMMHLPHPTSVAYRKGTRTLLDEENWKNMGSAFTSFFSPGQNINDIHKRGKWSQDHWIVDGLIRAGSNCLIVGESNVGKTYVAIELAVSMVSGERFLNHFECDRGPVVYIGGEGDKDMLVRRINNIALGKELDVKNFFETYKHMLILSLPEDFGARYPSPLANKDYQNQVLELVTSVDRKLRPRGFFFDPLSALVPDVDKDPNIAQLVVNFAKTLNKECEAATFFLHHPKKKQTSGPEDHRSMIRGESSWVNFVDDVICIDSDADDPNVIHFWGNKARDNVAPGDTESMFGAKRTFEPVENHEELFPGSSPGAVQKTRFTFIPHKKKMKEPKKRGKVNENVVELAPQNAPINMLRHQIMQVLNSSQQPLSRQAVLAALGSVDHNTYDEAMGQLIARTQVQSYGAGFEALYGPIVKSA